MQTVGRKVSVRINIVEVPDKECITIASGWRVFCTSFPMVWISLLHGAATSLTPRLRPPPFRLSCGGYAVSDRPNRALWRLPGALCSGSQGCTLVRWLLVLPAYFTWQALAVCPCAAPADRRYWHLSNQPPPPDSPQLRDSAQMVGICPDDSRLLRPRREGGIGWVADHRNHHAHADDEHDVHSPNRGFSWAHVLRVRSCLSGRLPIPPTTYGSGPPTFITTRSIACSTGSISSFAPPHVRGPRRLGRPTVARSGSGFVRTLNGVALHLAGQLGQSSLGLPHFTRREIPRRTSGGLRS